MDKKTVFKLILTSVIIGVGLYIGIFSVGNKAVKEQEKLFEIEGYGYSLHDTDTEVYKDNFNELKELLESEEIDKMLYAELLGKLFIIDFYTLDNKLTKNDVGGTEFVIDSFQNDFTNLAKTTIYKYIESNIYGNRNQDLPIVKDIEVKDVIATTFTYGEKSYETAYEVSLEWNYKQNLDYETKAVVKVVLDEDKLVIVEMD